MNTPRRLRLQPAVLLFSALLTTAAVRAQQDDKAEFEKAAAQAQFAITSDAYNNLLTVRLRLSQPPTPADPKASDAAVAAALAGPFTQTDEGTQMWRLYYREAPALVASIAPESMKFLSDSYQKVLKTKKPVYGSLFESWTLDLRFFLMNPQAEALLKDAQRMNYAVLLAYGLHLTSEGQTNEAKMQRAMGRAAMKAVKPRLAEGVKNAGDELTKKAAAMAAALGADAKSWEEFRKWFEGI